MTCEKQLLNRLKRAEGQIRGVTRMLEEGESCQDVLVQLTAVRSSVDRIIKLIAVDNLLDCVDESGRDHERVQDAINLIVKSR
ncbi:metal-sensitive transcriptional regulator [Erysipelothrix rhusiopathiae]|uniref:Copper-sensing transcriptional repressor CsoR n=3 Tax=Erysipelothrix TaxID=1647 RepID=E7FXH2_ERYRH|nr:MULTISPECIES: metal-sensitive transcriptional regulator [Erysipelothrix]CAH2761421.1 metal-sensitive transcriptional regulator [Erysipelothrix sp. A18Y020d]AGN25379.1 hypothetical protein K210_09110 [Erysipelothrix rhusiopathiae SY1027]AMS11611.1 hypothetical protein A2I91_07630 [Erysipelothrix rhusiopathiae]AOO68110.1 hypothetical protein BC346_07150 [Erysipelothrix rhusiopathiae]AWU41041.1 metal-sensitive transcriptional regulator [Erysipelothrix rhusiopathiae]